MKRQRLAGLLIAGAMLIGLTGCTSFGADVESQLRPPQANGEQGRIEAALSAYIASTLTQENYVLKYPQSGEYRSAFVLEDLNGDGNQEALAFYRLGPENGTTHINLLHISNGEWKSVSDFEGIGSDIESVCFGDMDGDGVKELFLCWDMFSSRTYQLSMYSLKGNRIVESFTNNCARVTVGDLTGDGRDNCLLFHMGTDQLTASLWTMQSNVMEEVGQVVVDTAVQKLHADTVVALTESQNGVFLDCTKGGDTLVTELLFWDGKQLKAPLYNSDVSSENTLRLPAIPSGDMDEDGAWEWPTCTLLRGFEADNVNAQDTTRWETTFWSWDAVAEQPVEKFSCIYNAVDGYYLQLEDGMKGAVTTRYNEMTGTLWVYPMTENGIADEALLAVRTTPNGQKTQDEEAVGYKFRTLIKNDMAEYAVWYSEEETTALNMEKLRYMLTLL